MVDSAVSALGNIANTNIENRDLVLSLCAVPALLDVANKCISTGRFENMKDLIWTLSVLCKGDPLPVFDVVRSILPVFSVFIYNVNDVDVMTNILCVLSLMSQKSSECIRSMIDIGMVLRILELLEHESEKVQTSAIQIIGKFIYIT